MRCFLLYGAKLSAPRNAGSSARIRTDKGESNRGGISEIVRIGGAAVSALMVCSPMLLAARPKTPLRVFCVAAFEYLAQLRGGTLGQERRAAIAHACDFGSLRDAYYDEQKLDLKEYRWLRSALRRTAPEAATIYYVQELRKAERGRPILAGNRRGLTEAIIKYRVAVIELSLRWLDKISGLPLEGVKFHALVNLICLIQLVDDLLDWKDDLSTRCPSYVTALILEQPRPSTAATLRVQADELLLRIVTAARKDAGVVPFAIAGRAAWAFVIALLKVRFRK